MAIHARTRSSSLTPDQLGNLIRFTPVLATNRSKHKGRSEVTDFERVIRSSIECRVALSSSCREALLDARSPRLIDWGSLVAHTACTRHDTTQQHLNCTLALTRMAYAYGQGTGNVPNNASCKQLSSSLHMSDFVAALHACIMMQA